MSVTLTNAEKQVATRTPLLVSMARRCAPGSFSRPAPTLKWTGLARHSGYTITDLVDELVERGGQRQGQGVYTLLMESRRRDYAGTAALSMARRPPSTK
jgi:hypothetical protein